MPIDRNEGLLVRRGWTCCLPPGLSLHMRVLTSRPVVRRHVRFLGKDFPDTWKPVPRIEKVLQRLLGLEVDC